MNLPADNRDWLDRPLSDRLPALTIEKLLFAVILLLAVVSRLYGLGDRIMSHDEALHVYDGWRLSTGMGYSHGPGTHGPLQFHLIALSYTLFGDSDFTARLPHALASLLTVLLLWKWRRYLGRTGTLLGAGLMVISPYLLYYGRYARNEAFVGLLGLLTLYAILRYLETGRSRHLLLLTAATALHFTTKETSFIYTGQALLFLGIFLINRLTRQPWGRPRLYNAFLGSLAIGILLLGGSLGYGVVERAREAQAALEMTEAQLLDQPLLEQPAPPMAIGIGSGLAIGAAAFLLGAAGLAIAGYGWQNLRRERSFDILILLGTVVLPQLAAFPVSWLGRNPINYYETLTPNWNAWLFLKQVFDFSQAAAASDLVFTARAVILLFAVSVAIGLLWKPSAWWTYALLFWGIFAIFYTTLFTNLAGLGTGLVGSLGYWLEQQGVARGAQPWYYYALVQIPIYEFLPALGFGLAATLGFRLRKELPGPEPQDAQFAGPQPPPEVEPAPGNESEHSFALLAWWAVSSFLAYTIAGEKMPWLTYHITLPMILLTGWALGRLIERFEPRSFRQQHGWLVLVLMGVFLVAFLRVLFTLLGAQPPFQGKDLVQLQATYAFLGTLMIATASGAGLWHLARGWSAAQFLRLGTLAFFGLLTVLTARAATRAAYIHYDEATEYLVYAHGAAGVGDALGQIETIAARTSGADHTLLIASDNAGTGYGTIWPFRWYLRHYSNVQVYSTPDVSLRSVPVIMVDESHFDDIGAIVGDNYFRFDYIRMVWPNQDYFHLNWSRVREALTNPAMRQALLDIWLNRDYTAYAAVTGSLSVQVENWNPSGRMRLYVRRDLGQQIWEYGSGETFAAPVDPYEQGLIVLAADSLIGTHGQAAGLFDSPRGVAVAPDDSLYVADSRNHRIQHFSADGQFLDSWGGFAQTAIEVAPLGTFNEPWGVAVSPDGERVYVTDTWNHRVQVFTSSGTPLTAWGYPGFDQIADPYGYWGPRGIAVDSQGRVYVADTGNKRILIYDADGLYLTQFGTAGMGAGQFDEPTGVAVGPDGRVYVADTWNRRIQVFTPDAGGLVFIPVGQWDITGWYGDSLDNKPFLTVDAFGRVFVTDPGLGRVLEFTDQGLFVRAWGDLGFGPESIGIAAAVAVDSQGRVWVTDAGNHRLMRFPPTTTFLEIPVVPVEPPAESSPDVIPPPETCRVSTGSTGGWLNLRSCPGTSCSIVDVLPEGLELVLLDSSPEGDWIAVQVGDLPGWVNSNYCER
ncbi:MAG: TIGR03663 family protein [Anaerolineales bacterium]|nr:TIGR03663 family protein [Anaerolineales bacterium]